MARRKMGQKVDGWVIPGQAGRHHLDGGWFRGGEAAVRRPEGGDMAERLDPLATGILPIALGRSDPRPCPSVDGWGEDLPPFTLKFGEARARPTMQRARGHGAPPDQRPTDAEITAGPAEISRAEITQVPPGLLGHQGPGRARL